MSSFHDSYNQLGHRHGPPDGGQGPPDRRWPCAPVKSINIALLTEGGLCYGEIYKHCPPDRRCPVLR